MTTSTCVPPPIDRVETCRRCTRPSVQPKTWREVDSGTRASWKRAGLRRLSGRGLCVACYQWCKVNDHLHEYSQAKFGVTGSGQCTRCGLAAGLVDGLCQDCTHVTSDLGEREVWAS